ncbi:virulence factor SrfB [Pseudopelagicola sp. nBUS_20]|uniref:virulence factor SrfB n=1 Tax=Pseudopelagicola sp. nBUS_20 TaxID=3395317 RepID=UPI003EBC8F8B
MEVVPFSGIQILDFEIDISSLPRAKKNFGLTSDGILYPLDISDRDSDYAERFSENYSSILNEFQEKWLPAPVFRDAGTAEDGLPVFDEGPSTWARLRAKVKARDLSGNPTKIICQIALDTAIDVDEDDKLSGEDFYLMPSRADVLFEKEFSFVSDPSQMDWFLDSQIEDDDGVWIDTQEWIAEWITNVLEENGVKKNKLDLHRVWAKYFTLIELFSFCGVPTLKLIDTITDNKRYTPIDTDFVIDLGNSRTCGILLEKPNNQEARIEAAIPFEIRDFENAEIYHSGLMESRVELAHANFGRDDLAKRTGRNGAFLWPSPVRVGVEARSLQMKSDGTDAASGLSSAKRYLWDIDPTEREWRFSHANPNAHPPIAIRTRKLLTEAGDFRKSGENYAREMRFSKSSFMMFMIAELIAHAFVQINNPQMRAKRPNSAVPRRLSKIILTIPTATPAREQKILKERASDALDYVWQLMSLPVDNSHYKKPSLSIEWDEASCSQQVFLFNEISEIYAHKAKEYFCDFGKIRNIRGSRSPSLRIASIDIGGGTTDLMITCYACEQGNVIHPVQEFREGFRVAGDDLLFEIIRGTIFPCITKFLNDIGGRNSQMALANFFKATDDTKAAVRACLTNSIFVPAAIQILSKFEEMSEEFSSISIGNLLSYGGGIFKNVLNSIANDCGLNEWPSSDIRVEIKKPLFEACVENVLGKVVGNISTALANFDCDYVLLTGRPSKQPYIRDLFARNIAINPNRLISLHAYTVGTWYPFRDALSGKIGDPKSTVVVGALVNSVSSFELTNYSFKSEELCLRSTCTFIGETETSGKLPDEKIIIDNVENQNEEEFNFQFYNAVHFGARQISDEMWTTSPLYRLSLPSSGLGNFTLPFKVTLRRQSDAFEEDELRPNFIKESQKEEIEIYEIEDAEGLFAPNNTLRLSFNTLGKVENYWLETGLFA